MLSSISPESTSNTSNKGNLIPFLDIRPIVVNGNTSIRYCLYNPGIEGSILWHRLNRIRYTVIKIWTPVFGIRIEAPLIIKEPADNRRAFFPNCIKCRLLNIVVEGCPEGILGMFFSHQSDDFLIHSFYTYFSPSL
ncbi:hypothetical protein ES703_121649 [subsurface metagenome]